MELTDFQTLGFGTAVAVVAITAAAAVFRKWKREDDLEKELHDAEKGYQKALDDWDLVLAATYYRRMQKLRERIGKT